VKALLTLSLVAALCAGCRPAEEDLRRLIAEEVAHGGTQYIKPSAVIGPYTPAVRSGNLLFVSGQIAIDPATGILVKENIEAETRQVLTNLDRVLKASGYDSSNVVSATVYLKNMGDYAAMNGIYGKFFPEGKYPARAAIQVAALPKDANIEIAVIACK
jgi:2-iminobutanoate/2-iminopropanoate deaminase